MSIVALPPPSPLVAYSSDTLFSKQSGRRLRLDNPDYSGQWNWGAFFFSWLWLFNHGRSRLAFGFLLLDCIPIVGLIAHVYCGMKGNDLAYDSRRFESIAQFRAVQQAWRNWGFALMTCVAGAVFALEGAQLLHDTKSMLAVAQARIARGVHATAARRSAPEMRAAVAPTHTQTVALRATAMPVALRTAPAMALRATAAPVAMRATAAPIAMRATAAPIAMRAAVALVTPPSPRVRGVPADRAAFQPRATFSLDTHPCEAALDFVDAAVSATADKQKYAMSVAAIKLAGACHKSALALRAVSLALSEKAIAEHNGRFGDWRKDIGDSIRASSLCMAQGDADGANADCHDMADHETQIAIVWEIEKK